jgi:2,3-bisphosphoglycerate-independent phosphoglycerate mutase
MSASEITHTILNSLESGKHEVIIVNFANCDLVGHSGDLKATIKAVETIDDCVGQIHAKAMKAGYTFMLTGDHGNADDMLYPDGSQKPAHSMNPVILLIADPAKRVEKVRDGGLADVAPTLLNILGLPKPEEMTGESLID